MYLLFDEQPTLQNFDDQNILGTDDLAEALAMREETGKQVYRLVKVD